MPKKFSRFDRPPIGRRKAFRLSGTDLHILETILRYRFSPTSELMRLVGGHPDVIHRRLRALWEHEYISRFAFADPRRMSHTEFHYYLDDKKALELLLHQQRIPAIHPTMEKELRGNRDANYAQTWLDGSSGQGLFLRHQLMVSRLRFMLEKACWQSNGEVELPMFRHGADLEGHKVEVPEVHSRRTPGSNEYLWQESDETRLLPLEPDAIFTLRFPKRATSEQEFHFAYEADRGTMPLADMLRKFRAYYFFIKKHKRHQEAFGIHPIRAVLVEAPDDKRALKLMDLAGHPLVSGQSKRSGLFWFTISPLFTEPAGTGLPTYLERPSVILERQWALPDFTKLALGDAENSPRSAHPRPEA